MSSKRNLERGSKATVESQIGKKRKKNNGGVANGVELTGSLLPVLEVPEPVIVESPVVTSLQKEFQCSICQDIAIKAHGLACSHMFCEYCITRWLEKNHKCPFCRESVHSGRAYPSVPVDRVIAVFFDTQPDTVKLERTKNIEERDKLVIEMKAKQTQEPRRSRYPSDSDSDSMSGFSDSLPGPQAFMFSFGAAGNRMYGSLFNNSDNSSNDSDFVAADRDGMPHLENQVNIESPPTLSIHSNSDDEDISLSSFAMSSSINSFSASENSYQDLWSDSDHDSSDDDDDHAEARAMGGMTYRQQIQHMLIDSMLGAREMRNSLNSMNADARSTSSSPQNTVSLPPVQANASRRGRPRTRSGRSSEASRPSSPPVSNSSISETNATTRRRSQSARRSMQPLQEPDDEELLQLSRTLQREINGDSHVSAPVQIPSLAPVRRLATRGYIDYPHRLDGGVRFPFGDDSESEVELPRPLSDHADYTANGHGQRERRRTRDGRSGDRTIDLVSPPPLVMRPLTRNSAAPSDPRLRRRNSRNNRERTTDSPLAIEEEPTDAVTIPPPLRARGQSSRTGVVQPRVSQASASIQTARYSGPPRGGGHSSRRRSRSSRQRLI